MARQEDKSEQMRLSSKHRAQLADERDLKPRRHEVTKAHCASFPQLNLMPKILQSGTDADDTIADLHSCPL
ncbi:hypothetical protein MHYP_G00075500 [Metynnis hypsauchen]